MDGEVVAQFPAATEQRPVRSALESKRVEVHERKRRSPVVQPTG